jgi:hypothetical protein
MGIEIAFLIALLITFFLTFFIATLTTLDKSLIGSEFVGLMVGIGTNRLDLFDRGILDGRIFRGLWGLGRIE